MLPYSNTHGGRFWVSQEATQPNPSSSFFTMAPPQQLEQQQHYDHFFHGHGQFNSETLEAVLRSRPSAPQPAEAEAAQESVIRRNGAVAAGGHAARARKRPFRTDRHSKIRTAQGVRDRRMRLSLDVARDFFGLQDQLGFDKASKTVDWLLTQSKPAIDRLYESSRLNASGEAGTSSLNPAAAAKTTGSGNKRGSDVKNEGASGGGSVLMEHSCELNGGGGLIPAPAIGGYYYELGEMMNTNGGDRGDDDGEGEYEEDGDFLDGMQY